MIRARPVGSTRMFDWGVSMGCLKKTMTITYSLEISMDYIAKVEEMEAFSDVGQLGRWLVWHTTRARNTHKTDSVCFLVIRNISRQVPVKCPTRNDLEGIGGDTQNGSDIWVGQIFPCYGRLVEGLRGSLGQK